MAENREAREYSVRMVRRGELLTRLVVAPTAAAACREVAGAGGVVVSVRNAVRSSRSDTLPREEVAWWCEEVRSLVRSGMTVVEALETMVVAAPPGSRRASAQATLLEHLNAGLSLSKSMERVPGFPPLLIASIAAAERSSSVAESLDEYLIYDSMIDRLRRQVIGAAIYPAIVAALGFVVVVFLLIFVVPRFTRMYAELPSASVGFAAKLVLSLSQLLSQNAFAVVIAAVALVVAAVAGWQSDELRNRLLAAVGRTSGLKLLLDGLRLTQFFHALGLMTRGGYPLADAMQVCARMAPTKDLGERIERAREQIATGRQLGAVFMDAGLADVVTARLLSVGERTGEFGAVLQTIAERHGARFSTVVERVTRFAEPLLLLTVAVLVGGIVVVMYMPIFDIAGQIGLSR